ncbi:hypothetical protein GIS00_14170 [Nakamurella sp. YIM 132087]|uniref:Uncharacterized protein n=1 Tax=Nakamurella alba TaxID=2665158 RepID=A0A7K1FLR2_9ACTN|nr:hypothetical protein [Nakamurella alba]MTD15085.1 hypothetical protein [Nakamurella alba]
MSRPPASEVTLNSRSFGDDLVHAEVPTGWLRCAGDPTKVTTRGCGSGVRSMSVLTLAGAERPDGTAERCAGHQVDPESGSTVRPLVVPQRVSDTLGGAWSLAAITVVDNDRDRPRAVFCGLHGDLSAVMVLETANLSKLTSRLQDFWSTAATLTV